MIDIFSSNESLAFYLSYAVIALVVFLTAIIGPNTKSRWRYPVIAVFFVAFLGISYVSLGELLGRPKPVPMMAWSTPDVKEARVLGMFMKQGHSINLLLMYDGLQVPRYYQYPWDKDMAQKLRRGQQAQRLGEIKDLKLRLPFQFSHEDRKFPEVHEVPWPAPELKDNERQDVIDLDSIQA